MKTGDALEALAFAYGYGLGGLEPCPDDRVPEDDVREWLSELIRKEREEAWLEGWNTGNDYYGECEKGNPKDSWKYDEDQNPYRKEQS